MQVYLLVEYGGQWEDCYEEKYYKIETLEVIK